MSYQAKENLTENYEINDFIEKLSCNKNQNNYDDHLIGSLEKRRLNESEIILFKEKHEINIQYAVTSKRIYTNNKVYHSSSYKRKGESDSFTISYTNNKKKEKFAQIIEFIQHSKKFYAIAIKIKIIKNDPIINLKSGFFNNILKSNNLFSRFFKLIEVTDEKCLIDCTSFRNRCIIVNNNEQLYLTKINCDFEHDSYSYLKLDDIILHNLNILLIIVILL
jgi:hypothetical protein